MRGGTRKLLRLAVPSPLKAVVSGLDNATKLALGHSPYPSVPALLDDCVGCAIDWLVTQHGGPAWHVDEFARLRQDVAADLVDVVDEIVRVVATVLRGAQELRRGVNAPAPPNLAPSLTDIGAQLDSLVYAGFVLATGRTRLPDLTRYLRAAQRRLDTLPAAPARDREQLATVSRVERERATWLAELPERRRSDPDVEAVRWMVEELRVSLFAQTIGTAYPVSEKRIYRAMDAASDRAAGA
jgi:ATP-dependent RNA helicase HrpA